MQAISKHLETYSHRFVKWTGTTSAFMTALITILLLLGVKVYSVSQDFDNSLNTWTSLITFLLIFLMQRSQNKEFQALQIKLNELISAQHNARNDLINIERSSEEHLNRIQELHEQEK